MIANVLNSAIIFNVEESLMVCSEAIGLDEIDFLHRAVNFVPDRYFAVVERKEAKTSYYILARVHFGFVAST